MPTPSAASIVQGHMVVLSFPAQGHLNPALQFSKHLIKMGMQVTFVTSVFAHRRISKTTETPEGLKFSTFSDGYDDGYKKGHDLERFRSEHRHKSCQKLKEVIATSADEGRPITCLVHTLLLPWAAEVARECQIPHAILWIQPATVLDIYYYYFNGYEDVIAKNCSDPSWSIELPGLPRLAGRDLPSFLLPSSSDTYSFALPTIKKELDNLDVESNPKILVNTFDALETEALRAIEKCKLIGIGPLIPSAFLDKKDPSDKCFGGDLFQKSKDYVGWLSSNRESSVVYVSFGSILELPKRQKEEIAIGLLLSRRPFLWVMREKENGEGKREEEEEEEMLSCMEELEQQGMIVPWCSQLEVLSHPSLGCFVTHCGWNSTMESLVSGVPAVAFPVWSDQGTNAKLIEDVWKTGVRVGANEEGIVVSDELKRCIETVMGDGERAAEMRRNAKKWKDLAAEAVKEGGSSDKNLKNFVEEIGEGCV
ncbi:Hexosyltransferase [Sarracenia purpurea var. burkii]